MQKNLTLVLLVCGLVAANAQSSTKADKQIIPSAQLSKAVIWREQADISKLDLYNGQGGTKHMPTPPFTFEAEATTGTNPKFDIRDADGHKWRVKLGEEAKPEVVASRLLWAVGYFANDDYVLPEASVEGLKLKRGGDRVGPGGTVTNARFQRRPGGEKKIGIWQWESNPFVGTKQWNGLRVMMAVINNWDLKDENNAVYSDEKGDDEILLCSDVGASFGTNGLSFTRARGKGNVDSFRSSKFIVRKTEAVVDFATPAPPSALLLKSFGFAAISYAERQKLDRLGKDIPLADARWVGSLLAQLSDQQLHDAFRAGHFSDAEISAYVDLVEQRIKALGSL